jgi:hypothetical protein
VQGGIAMNRTDILNVLMDNRRVSERGNDSESTTMIRLNELHVKAGSARQQQYESTTMIRLNELHVKAGSAR